MFRNPFLFVLLAALAVAPVQALAQEGAADLVADPSPVVAATVRVSCDRLERIERQVDDLHKLMIPARNATGGTNIAHTNQ